MKLSRHTLSAFIPPEAPTSLLFTVRGEIVPKQRPRFGRGHTYTPSKTVFYETLIAINAKAMFARPWPNPCNVHITAFFQVPKGLSAKKKSALLLGHCMKNKDIDNIAKSVMDSLNGIAYLDDKQVVSLKISKHWADVESIDVIINYL